MIIITFLAGFLIITICYLIFRGPRKVVPLGKEVPRVKNNLPLVGHGPAFSKDIIGYIRKCQEEYGNIFRLQIFNKDMIVVCDRSLTNEFFKATEDKMSLYDVLDSLYFSDGFSDNPETLPLIIKMVKSTIAVNFDTFSPKIMDEANRMIQRMRNKCANQKIDLVTEMMRFVTCTSARCFINMDLTDEVFENLLEFAHVLNKLVVLTYFLPKRVIGFWYNKTLSSYRMKVHDYVQPEIQKYRDDPDKKDSLVFRKCVDYSDPDTGKTLTDVQISEIIICLLYVSSENTSLGLSNCISDLARYPEYWDMVKNETKESLENNDPKALFALPILDACFKETCRMNTHIFALNRRPKDINATLGEYYVGDAQCVALCEPMYMVWNSAGDIYKQASEYNPKRFLEKDEVTGETESSKSNHLMTFGSNVHLCPGRGFATMEVKAAAAFITNNLKFEIAPGDLGKMDYFSPSAFAFREISAKVIPLENPVEFNSNNLTINLQYNNNQYKILALEEGGWLIRDALSRDQQIDLFNYTIELSKGEKEHDEITNSEKTAFPITYHNLVYTGKSNCPTPEKWYLLATEIWGMLLKYNSKLKFPIDENTTYFTPNSLYAQMFSENASMSDHYDQYVNWGVSVSLGASCDFNFGKSTLVLHTGDILIADFSKIKHGVPKIHNNIPAWMSDENDNKVQTFGKARMSIQIRDLSNCNNPNIMTTEAFKSMVQQS